MDTGNDEERRIDALRRRWLDRMGIIMLAVEAVLTFLLLDYGPIPDPSTLMLMLIPLAETFLCSRGGLWSVLHDSPLAFAASLLMTVPLTLLMAYLALNTPHMPLVTPIVWFVTLLAWFIAVPLYWRILRHTTF